MFSAATRPSRSVARAFARSNGTSDSVCARAAPPPAPRRSPPCPTPPAHPRPSTCEARPRDEGGARFMLGLHAEHTVCAIVNHMVNDLMLDRAFAACAHPIRRGIIERLADSEMTVGEATRDFAVSKPAISRHLRVLEEAGAIVRVIDGRTHRLRLDRALRLQAVARRGSATSARSVGAQVRCRRGILEPSCRRRGSERARRGLQ